LGSFSLGHWLVEPCVIQNVFGAGKPPRVMGDFAKGTKTFKANQQDDQVEEDRERLPTESRPSS
jgi:sec-independent protein translocase protein TatA